MRSCQEVRFWAESGLNFGMLSLSAYSHKRTLEMLTTDVRFRLISGRFFTLRLWSANSQKRTLWIACDCVGDISPGKLPHQS